MRPPDLEQQLQEALVAERYDEYERIAAVLDRQDAAERERRATVTLASAALWYVEQGLRVFPLRVGGKTPLFPKAHPDDSTLQRECKGRCGRLGHGCHDATTDPALVQQWWTNVLQANIGMATGTLVDVIDIDGEQGNISVAGILDELPPRVGWVTTPRPGGRHLYVPATGRGNDASILPGIDYRGTGGYVVVPPSVIFEGGRDYPGRYEWVQPLVLTALEATA